MKLLIEDLATDLTQDLTPTRNVDLYAIRPHLYLDQTPAGSLRVDVLDANGKLISSSEVVALSTITIEDYYHGYVRFLISAHLKKDTAYKIRLVGVSGYTTGVSWCLDFDLAKYAHNYSPSGGRSSSFDFEIWGYKEKTKGFY